MASGQGHTRQRKHVFTSTADNGDQSNARSDGVHSEKLLSLSSSTTLSSSNSSPDSLDGFQAKSSNLPDTSLELEHPIKPSSYSCRKSGKEREGESLLGVYVPMLLSYDEIPLWHQDNDYILHGYRPESRSVKACFASWFYLHNETVNIFTHLIPAIMFLSAEGWVFAYFRNGYPQAKPLERFVFAFFLLSAFLCLGLSATYHTLMNHSERVSHLWLRLDFVGIVVLTLGDFVSGIYMVFYCEPTLQKIYWAMILTLGTGTIIILVNPRFQGKKYRTFRASTFICTGLSGFAPLIHGWVKFGISQMMKQSGMPYYLGEGLLLISGAIFYTTRVPEALRPGRFDIFGCSHQIFHVLVVMATVVQLIGIMEAYDYNYHHRTCGPGYTLL